jgi:iron complex transport system substrate-binding protein
MKSSRGTQLLLILAVISRLVSTDAQAATVTDATGRQVEVPDHPAHVVPAGPPAAVLLAAIAPKLMVGFPGQISDAARSALAPEAFALPAIPRLTGVEDEAKDVQALHPDLIIDYGQVTPRYQKLARLTQEKTGVPTLLFDGALDQIPSVSRTLGRILHEPARGEAVAKFAEAILALPPPANAHPRVLYARGRDGTQVAAPNTDITAVFSALHWQVVAPEGKTTFRPATVDAIAALDPDIIILSDPAAKDVLTTPGWRKLRAVESGHAYVAPSTPFSWIEEPPSINRLLGVAWLRGGDPMTVASLYNATVYDRVLTTNQLSSIVGDTPAVKP